MSEFRQNFITKEWVVIATERSKRPEMFLKKNEERHALPDLKLDCPFCPGNETQTTDEIYRQDKMNSWSVRVVQNKYAALNPEHPAHREQVGKFLKSDGYGIAEVVIETPRHDLTLGSMPVQQIVEMLKAFHTRFQSISAMQNICLITLFKNFGQHAGTSIEHPHSQIIATPIIPPHVRDPFQKAMMHFDTYGVCGYCDMIEEELKQKKRIIFQNNSFVVFCPFASRTPFEIRIYPTRHVASYSWISEMEILHFAEALSFTLKKLERGLNTPDYNFIIRSSPIGDEDVRYLHWYFILIPKIATPAGFEIGTGIYINTTLPEECAEYLRGITIQDVE